MTFAKDEKLAGAGRLSRYPFITWCEYRIHSFKGRRVSWFGLFLYANRVDFRRAILFARMAFPLLIDRLWRRRVGPVVIPKA